MQRQFSRTKCQPLRRLFKTLILGLGMTGAMVALPKTMAAQSALEGRESGASNIQSPIDFRPKTDKPHPEKTESGGVRDDALCFQDVGSQSLPKANTPRIQAVVPRGVMKHTASARPTFWVAIPETQAQKVILSIGIQSESESETYHFHSQTEYPLSQTPALIGLTMPEDAPDLALDKLYQWSVVLVCSDTLDPSDPGISAYIKRINPSELTPSPTQASTIQQQAIWFSQNGLWHDAVSTLLEAHQTQPNDPEIHRLWQALLLSVNLDDIAQHYGPQQGNVVFP